MKRMLLALAILLCACHKPKECVVDPDAGTSLDQPCAGKDDGAECCLGATSGTCHGGRCSP